MSMIDTRGTSGFERAARVARVVVCSLVATACGSEGGPTQNVIPGPGPLPVNPASCAVTGAPLALTDVTVTLNQAQRFQTIQGFGHSLQLFDSPHLTNSFDPVTRRAAAIPTATDQARILDALYGDIGLTRVRYLQKDDTAAVAGLELVNDNADPNVADLSKFDFTWRKNDGPMDFVKSAIPRGVTTYWSSTLTLESWMTESNPAEYAEWAMVILRRWKAQGLEMPYWSIVNEPSYWRSGVWSPEFQRDAIKLLGARMRAEGFNTRFVVADDVTPGDAHRVAQVVLADPVARQYVGAIAYHLYDFGFRDRVKQLSQQYGIPVWMTEYYTDGTGRWLEWATIMHDMLADYDVAAIDYMWGFFGQADGAQLVRIRSNGPTYLGFDFNRQFYVMGQYSKFVRPGAVRVGAVSENPDVEISAFARDGQVVIVALNKGQTSRSVRFEYGTGGPCLTTVTPVRTSGSEEMRSLPAITLDAPRFAATLPAASITTFVAR